MNDKLHQALNKLTPEVSETGVWQELQKRVNARRRRNRMLQAALGAIAVLAIGLGASSLLQGTPGPDFAEQTTTTVSTSTTTTTVVGSPVNAVDVSTIDGSVWAVYLFVGRDVGAQEAQDIRAALGRIGLTNTNGLMVEADLACDLGAAEALQISQRAQFIAAYFADEADARAFTPPSPVPILAIAEVEHVCSPDQRLSSWRPTTIDAVLGPLSPYYSVDDMVTVHGEISEQGMVWVQGQAPDILEGTYFEAQVPLIPGLNAIEVQLAFADGEETVSTLEVTYVPDAIRQFAFIGEFTGEFVVDYAEFLTGEAANEAAREAGEIGENETVPNDYYISNVNPLFRGLALADNAPIYVLGFDEEDGIKPVLVDRATFEAMFTGDFDPADWYGGDPRQLPYWLIIEGETILQIEQQYLP
jgi:hypothetical protein